MPSTLASDRARDDAEQHRDIGDEAGAPFDQGENDQQHEQRDAEPLKLAVIGIGEGAGDAVDHLGQGRQAAAGPVDADPHQRDADHQDDGSGDHRRKQRQQPADEGRGNDAEDSGSDHRAVDAEQADIGRRGHRQHRADRGERHPHHHGQPDADPGKAETLHQRREPAGEQVGRDQEGDVLRRQFQRPADDQGYRDRAGIHDQHMLQAERQQPRRRQRLVDRMDFAGRGHGWLPLARARRPVQTDTRPVPDACPGRQSRRLPNGTNVAQYWIISGDHRPAKLPAELEAPTCR